MPVQRLNHVNIRTPDVERTVAFFRDVLGLEPVPAPGGDPALNRWIANARGEALIHIGHSGTRYPTDCWLPSNDSPGTGAVHHVALECDDADAMKQRLTQHGCEWRESVISQIKLRQLFVSEPNGLLLELNFRE